MADVMAQLATLTDGLGLTAQQLAQLTANFAELRNQALVELATDTAKAENGSVMTRKGLDLLAKALAGKELKYTRVVFGDSIVDGKFVEVTDDEAVEFNDLLHARKEFPMVDVSFMGGGVCAIKVHVTNADVAEGFMIREVGVFAEDPDTQLEVLYCYKNYGVLANYLPSRDADIRWTIYLNIITVVDNATNVTAIIDASLLYVSQPEFVDHINSTNPHPNFLQKKEEVITTPYIWATGDDTHLHPMTIANLADLILGGDATNIPKMQSRISQAETNISNLYMQLQLDRDLGLVANLLLVEDFDGESYCDYYCERVEHAVAGVANACIASNDGLRPGCWYTISDGTHYELVQVTAAARNGDGDEKVEVAIFRDALQNTYDLSKTRLYRTTSLAQNGTSNGAGDIKNFYQSFDFEWQGTAQNSSSTLNLNTTLANSSSFELSGDYTFSSDGEFTIA